MRFILPSLLLFASAVSAQIPLAIGEWRTHVPYRNATSLADAGDRMYVSTLNFFFSYHKSTGEMKRFDKVTGLSDVGVSSVNFNAYNKTLLIAYENANIDLIAGNTIINISDIKRKLIIGDKTIYSVYFMDDLAYLSCGFGIVVLDMKRREIKDTYIIGNNGLNSRVYAFTADDNLFFAATEQGLKVADRNTPNLANFSEWTLATGLPVTQSRHVVNFNNAVFANVRDTLYRFSGNAWSYFYADADWKMENVSVSPGKLMLCESDETNAYVGRVSLIGENLVCCERALTHSLLRLPYDAAYDAQGDLWTADFLNGLLRERNGTMEGPIFPSGPGSASVQNISIERGQVWVAPGGVVAFNYGYNRDGAFAFVNNWWNNFNQYTNTELTDILSFYDVAVHPTEDKTYFASWWAGLAEYSNGGFTIYDKDNSILDPAEDANRTLISGLAFDSRENLWIASFSAEHPVIVKRKDGTWSKYRAPGVDGNWLTQVVVDDFDQKWFVISKTNSQGIFVFKEREDNTAATRILRTGQGLGNLPTNDVKCLVKDHDGEIWVGTGQGIAVFYCPSAALTNQGCEAQQIIVTVNGVAGYLLETENISSIAVDGANRKWVGTTNGVFVLSPEGTEQVAYYTVDNSPLLSNIITDIAIDGETGEVFIGTERGLVSLRGGATDGSTENTCALVYPNPVRENYEGPIALKGLTANATVKITDVNGMLFYETNALGGQAVWNGRNYNGERAKTGVYFIFTSNEDGSSTCITKLLIIN